MSAGIALAVTAIASAAAAGAQALSKPKVPKQTPTPTRNEAAEQAQKRDLLSRRRTPAADMLMGAGGAESSAGSKTSLGA
mgnify:CR=1 FL=1